MVNRESLPLIGLLLVPIIIVLIFFLYKYGYDITKVVRDLPILYFIILFPIILGFIVVIAKFRKSD